jgi:hypothetical protein
MKCLPLATLAMLAATTGAADIATVGFRLVAVRTGTLFTFR